MYTGLRGLQGSCRFFLEEVSSYYFGNAEFRVDLRWRHRKRMEMTGIYFPMLSPCHLRRVRRLEIWLDVFDDGDPEHWRPFIKQQQCQVELFVDSLQRSKEGYDGPWLSSLKIITEVDNLTEPEHMKGARAEASMYIASFEPIKAKVRSFEHEFFENLPGCNGCYFD